MTAALLFPGLTPAGPLVVVAAHTGGRAALAAAQGHSHRMADGGPACPATTTGQWIALRAGHAAKLPSLLGPCRERACFGGDCQ